MNKGTNEWSGEFLKVQRVAWKPKLTSLIICSCPRVFPGSSALSPHPRLRATRGPEQWPPGTAWGQTQGRPSGLLTVQESLLQLPFPNPPSKPPWPQSCSAFQVGNLQMDELIPKHSFRFSASQAARALSYFGFIIRDLVGHCGEMGPLGRASRPAPSPQPGGGGALLPPPRDTGPAGTDKKKTPSPPHRSCRPRKRRLGRAWRATCGKHPLGRDPNLRLVSLPLNRSPRAPSWEKGKPTSLGSTPQRTPGPL